MLFNTHTHTLKQFMNKTTEFYSPIFLLINLTDQATADKVLDEASRGAVVEHAASFLRPKGGEITAAMAQRFRKQVNTSSFLLNQTRSNPHILLRRTSSYSFKSLIFIYDYYFIRFHVQVQSLGLDMQKDTGFNEKLVTYLYALEVRACMRAFLQRLRNDLAAKIVWLHFVLLRCFCLFLSQCFIRLSEDVFVISMCWTVVTALSIHSCCVNKCYDVWCYAISCHLVLLLMTCRLLLPFLHLLISTSVHLLIRHLQLQQLVESGDESSLGDVQEAYDIPQEKAELIVEVSIGRERKREGTLLTLMRWW